LLAGCAPQQGQVSSTPPCDFKTTTELVAMPVLFPACFVAAVATGLAKPFTTPVAGGGDVDVTGGGYIVWGNFQRGPVYIDPD